MTTPFRPWVDDYPHPNRRDFPPINREALANVKRLRGRIAAAAEKAGNNQFGNRARLIMAGQEANARRAVDPVEPARLHLQRRGLIVFRANVEDGPKDCWTVRGQDHWFTDAEIIALAELRGFIPKQKDHEDA